MILGTVYILLSSLCFAASSSFGKVVTVNSHLSGAINAFSRFLLVMKYNFNEIIDRSNSDSIKWGNLESNFGSLGLEAEISFLD